MKMLVKNGQIIAGGRFVLALGLILLIMGCAGPTYFKVTDVQSSKVYYTENLENFKGGIVKLKDASTGSLVTLQNSEVKEITSQEYQEAVGMPVVEPSPNPVKPK